MLLVIAVPRSLRARDLATKWATMSRKVHRRLQYGIDSIARHYGLPFFVDVETLRDEPRIRRDMNEYVASLLDQTLVNVAPTCLEQLGTQLRDDTLPLRTTLHVDNESYARVDRPRARVTKARATVRPPSTPAASIVPSIDCLLERALLV